MGIGLWCTCSGRGRESAAECEASCCGEVGGWCVLLLLDRGGRVSWEEDVLGGELEEGGEGVGGF